MITSVNPNTVPKRALSSGENIPCIGMGTFGSDRFSAQEIADAVTGAIQFGYRMFDCASVYGNEENIGRAFARVMQEGIVTRDELFITSKVWNDMHGKGDVLISCEKTLRDLQLNYVDLYFVHWPFANYHAPGCSGDARSPDATPFSIGSFMGTWRQMESLVDQGLTRYIGMSNMTIPKLEAILPLCRIQPIAIEMELHPSFQQEELFQYCLDRNIQPIGFCPIGSPSRPDRDKTDSDVSDTELPEVVAIAKAHNVHPAIICLKWAVQRGQIPIPFAVDEKYYASNLLSVINDPLTEPEMQLLRKAERYCRLIKGQVFLWSHAQGWEDLWDMDGTITR